MKQFMIGFLMLMSFSAFATTLSLYQNRMLLQPLKRGKHFVSHYMQQNVENMTQLNQNLGQLWAVAPGDASK